MMQYNDLEEKKAYFRTCEIHTSKELWDFVDGCKKQSDLVFRGVNEAKYMLYSSAQVRTNAALGQNSFECIINDSICKVRSNQVLMSLLRKRSHDETDFQILSLLQHYGCGTPIIDFSTNIDAALFFATDRQGQPVQTAAIGDRNIDSYISIYFFNKKDPNHSSVQSFTVQGGNRVSVLDVELRQQDGDLYKGISEETMESFERLPYERLSRELPTGGLFAVEGHTCGQYNYSVGGRNIEYDINNERIYAQDGLFLFNGLSEKPYEEAAKDWYSGIMNYCVNIHKSLEGEIKDYLKGKGITSCSIYPETTESKTIIKEICKLDIDERLKPKKEKKCSWKVCMKALWKFCKYVFVPQRRPQ